MVSWKIVLGWSSGSLVSWSLAYQLIYKAIVPPAYWPLSFDVRLVMLNDEDGLKHGVEAEQQAGRLSTKSLVTAFKFYDPWSGDQEWADFSHCPNWNWTWKETYASAKVLEARSVPYWRRLLARHDFELRHAFYQSRVKKLDAE